MKRRIMNLPLILLAITPAYGYEVSTAIQKKKILLEEFTGINCGNCPQGHAVAKSLTTAQKENAYTVAIHSGSYARPAADQPDYRTDIGEFLDTELGAYNAGYPCGTVNRHVFAGTSVITSRTTWTKNGKSIHEEDAPVNLWMESEFNGTDRTLTITVEGYYTADTEAHENMLNVLWTQSNIQGPQNGGGVGEDYIHKHMLRGYITEGWGDVIDNPRAGEYFTRTYTYTIPEELKGIGVLAEEIEVIAFVCADEREVLNVTGSKPVYRNYEKPIGAILQTPVLEMEGRYGFNYFEARLKSETDEPITSAGFEVMINGETQTASWEGNIPSFQTEELRIDVNPYEIRDENGYEIRLISLNGETVAGNRLSGTFFAPWEATPEVMISLQTDLYADENRFCLKDRDGNIVREFGPYETDRKATYEEELSLDPDRIYCLEVTDEWGDGIQQPKGNFKIYNAGREMIGSNYNIQQHGCRGFFRTNLTSDLNTTADPGNTRINYRKDTQTIHVQLEATTSGMAEIRIISVTGKTIAFRKIRVNGQETIHETWPASGLTPGLYLVNIHRDGKNETLKLSIY